MKNEGPYILEWVAHHLAVGVSNFLIFSDHCIDGTEHILERLDHLGHLRHAPNPKKILHQIPSVQTSALRYATQFNCYQDADWVLTIDTDEFVDIGVGNHRLADLFDETEPFDLVSFSVIGHNSNRVKKVGDGSVQTKFTRPIIEFSKYNAEGAVYKSAVKTMMRIPQPDAMFRNHRPKFKHFQATGQRWVNGSGDEMPEAFTDNKVNICSTKDSMGLARVNHYSIKSQEAFLVKTDRGDAMKMNYREIDDKRLNDAITYWNKRNGGLDNSPLKHNVPLGYDEILHEFMTDPVLKELHEKAVNTHSKIADRVVQTKGGEKLARMLGYFDT